MHASRPRKTRALSVAVAGALAGALIACLHCGVSFVLSARPLSGPHLSRTALLAKKKRGGGGGGGGGGGEEPEVEVDTEALLSEYQEKMSKSVDMLDDNLRTIRAGKATPQLLDSVKVSAYESQLKIEEVATVTATDATTLTVNVFDDTVVDAVAKAIQTADLGFTASTNGQAVKVSIPPLTKDKRAQYVKLAKDYAEKTKVAVRNVRQAAMKKIKGLKSDLPEDTARGMEKDVEAMVKKMNGDIDSRFKNKETELSTV